MVGVEEEVGLVEEVMEGLLSQFATIEDSQWLPVLPIAGARKLMLKVDVDGVFVVTRPRLVYPSNHLRGGESLSAVGR